MAVTTILSMWRLSANWAWKSGFNFRTIWRALIGWDIFSSIAPPSWPQTKIWLCHPFRLFVAVSMIPRIRLLGGYCGRHVLMTEFGVFTVNQPVAPVLKSIWNPEQCIQRMKMIFGVDILWRTERRQIPSSLPNSLSVSRYGVQKFPY